MPIANHLGRRLAATLALSTALSIAACGAPEDEANTSVPRDVVNAITETTALPKVAPVAPTLSRADLLAATRDAANRYAAGQALPKSDALVGRTFAVTLRFGCGQPGATGAAGDDGIAQARLSEDGKAIELTLKPADWTASPWLRDGEAIEQIDGFWIPRPWLTETGCPKVVGDPLQTATPASRQTVGLAGLHEAGASRVGRSAGRDYVHIIRGEGDAAAQPSVDGYRLFLAGRVASFADGRAIRCRAASADERPVCVVAVSLDHVAFQDTAGKTLSEWRGG